MMIRGLLFLLFLYTLLVWIAAVYLGGDFVQRGLFWTGVGVAALLVWLILERVIGWWRQSRARRPASTGAVPVPAPSKILHPDDAALAQLIVEANLRLKQSPAYRETATTIFDLPLYLVVGAEGSGKTSIVENSGIEAQLLAGQVSTGASTTVPTRVANIWLAKNSIYLEVGGRIFGGDTARFSEWLQQLRPVPVLTGVEKWLAGTKLGGMMKGPELPQNLRAVLMISDLREFTGTPELSKLDRAATAAREQLEVIASHFGVAFPVYVLFSRTDQILYFKDYFARMSENDAAKVFGLMTPREQAADAEQVWAATETRRLKSHFNELVMRLSDRRLIALTTDLAPDTRSAVYQFPREFKRIRTSLLQYLVDTFRPNPLKVQPTLRGFFFTGTRLVDRVAEDKPGAYRPSALDATQIFNPSVTNLFSPKDFGGSPAPQIGGGGARRVPAWMFLADVFHKVLLQDRPAMAAIPRAAAPQVPKLALGAAGALAALAVLVWGVSWFGNRGLVSDTRELVERMDQRGMSLTADNLRPVDDLRAQLERLASNKPWSLRWGLYSGDDALELGKAAYFRRLKSMFLEGANVTMVAGLMQPGDALKASSLYDRLKTHVTIAEKACAVDTALVNRVVDQSVTDWRPSLPADAAQLVRRQIAYYSSSLKEDEKPPLTLAKDVAAVQAAQNVLRTSGGVEQQLNGLLTQVAQRTRAIKVADRSPEYAKVLAGPAEFAGAYTKAGATLMESLIEAGDWGSGGEECVTGDNAGKLASFKQDAQAKKQMRDLYYLRYAAAWREFLRGFRVLPYGGIRDAATKLELLSGSQSPLLMVVKIVAENTNFPPPKPGEASGWEQIGQTIGKKLGYDPAAEKKKVQDNANLVNQALNGPAGLTAADVSKLFQPVLVTTPPDQAVLVSEANGAYVMGLRGLQQNLDAISRASQAEVPPMIPAAQAALATAKTGFRALADKFADTGNQGLNLQLADLLEQPIRLADSILPRNALVSSAGKVNADLVAMCRDLTPTLAKYPFNPRATLEATPVDIQRTFAPATGLVWQYQQRSLAEVVVRQGSDWVPAAPKPRVNPGLINFLNSAQQLTDVFFTGANGTMQLKLSYALRPVPQSAHLRLRLDGGEMNSAKSSLQTEFVWPAASEAAQGAEGGLILTDGQEYPFGKHEKLWAAFHLFQNADQRNLGDKRVSWTEIRGLGGATPQRLPTAARVEFVRFPGGADLFNPKFFEGLRCPPQAVIPE